VYLIIDTATALLACIVSLWGEHQMFCKLGITVESSYALYDIPRIKFEDFISDLDLLALEARPAF